MSHPYYQEYSTRPSRGFHFHLLAKGSTNPKMKKQAEQLGILPFGLSLSPATASGAGNVCPRSSAGCSAVCLNYAGRGQMSSIQRARIQKTRFWFSDRAGFLELLTQDLEKVQRLAGKHGKLAAVRLNVFSDIPWERFLDLDRFPGVQFYDYTKISARFCACSPTTCSGICARNWLRYSSRMKIKPQHKRCGNPWSSRPVDHAALATRHNSNAPSKAGPSTVFRRCWPI